MDRRGWISLVMTSLIGLLALPIEDSKESQYDECGETDRAKCVRCVAFTSQACLGASGD